VTRHLCDICDNPLEESAFVCQRCTDETTTYLRQAVDLAGEVETSVARLGRYAVRAGSARPEPEEPKPTSEVNRRHPVEAFAWDASRDRPKRGGLRETALLVDLNASARAAGAFGSITTWARTVEDDHGGRVPDVQTGDHPAAVAAAWLIGQLDWMRHQQFAGEAFEELKAAGAVIRRIVDAPPEQELVGVCDCEAYLYARRGAAQVRCVCGLSWMVRKSRQSLLDVLADRLVTVSEAATLGVIAFPDLSRERVRKLVGSWVRTDRPNHLIGTATDDGPVYPFREILDRLSSHVIRGEQRDHANVAAA
jgi:hypothetical protein